MCFPSIITYDHDLRFMLQHIFSKLNFQNYLRAYMIDPQIFFDE